MDQGMWRIVGSQIVLPLIWKKLHLPLTIVMIPSLDVLQESKFFFFFSFFLFFFSPLNVFDVKKEYLLELTAREFADYDVYLVPCLVESGFGGKGLTL